MKHLPTLALALGAIFALPAQSFAACASPVGAEGDLRYDSTAKSVYFCNDTNWIEMGGTNASTPSAMSLSTSTTDGDLSGDLTALDTLCNGDYAGYVACTRTNYYNFLSMGAAPGGITLGSATTYRGVLREYWCNGHTSSNSSHDRLREEFHGRTGYRTPTQANCAQLEQVWCCDF